jgi:ring-1,2-phenylacetyl-CoA epoxidase subunit PaaC
MDDHLSPSGGGTRALDGGEWIAGTKPAGPTSGAVADPLFEYLLRLADDRLVLGHRLSEWCGHAPILEEDIALTNFALDFVGQAAALLGLAGEREGKGRDADALAYFRDAYQFRNVILVELPNGDFGHTIVRQFLFDAYDVPLLAGLQGSTSSGLAGIAAKALKEARYHLRHSAEWLVRLGDGTAESHERVQRALDALWGYTRELFVGDRVAQSLAASGQGVDPSTLVPQWERTVHEVLPRATLRVPPTGDGMITRWSGRRGRHSEHLGHLLAEMQSLPRSHPGAAW